MYPSSFSTNQNPSIGQRNKSLLESPYFEFLGFSSYFQQFSYRVHKALVMKVAHFLNFSVMITDASFKLLHESSMFLTIIDRPLKKNCMKITPNLLLRNRNSIIDSEANLCGNFILKVHLPQSNPIILLLPQF